MAFRSEILRFRSSAYFLRLTGHSWNISTKVARPIQIRVGSVYSNRVFKLMKLLRVNPISLKKANRSPESQRTAV